MVVPIGRGWGAPAEDSPRSSGKSYSCLGGGRSAGVAHKVTPIRTTRDSTCLTIKDTHLRWQVSWLLRFPHAKCTHESKSHTVTPSVCIVIIVKVKILKIVKLLGNSLIQKQIRPQCFCPPRGIGQTSGVGRAAALGEASLGLPPSLSFLLLLPGGSQHRDSSEDTEGRPHPHTSSCDLEIKWQSSIEPENPYIQVSQPVADLIVKGSDSSWWHGSHDIRTPGQLLPSFVLHGG